MVILDEVDQLQDERVLYDLYRTRGISMILIANQETELLIRLDDRLVSRLHAATRIRFEKYELEELVSILEDRVRWGLDEQAIGRDQLVTIADAAAGDARRSRHIWLTVKTPQSAHIDCLSCSVETIKE